jgi:chromosome partitioning protein
VDGDPQANSTSGLGHNPKEVTKSIYECMVDGIPAIECVVGTNINYLDLLPAHIDLVGAEIELIGLEEREYRMKKSLESVRNNYDFILIDCNPSLGLITVNALTASDSVLVPVQCEYFALEGIAQLMNTIKIVKENINTALEIEGVLLTMYDQRVRLCNMVVEEVRNHFQDLTFETIIPRNIKLSESPSFGLPVIAHDAESKGAISYINLANEILERNKLSIPA